MAKLPSVFDVVCATVLVLPLSALYKVTVAAVMGMALPPMPDCTVPRIVMVAAVLEDPPEQAANKRMAKPVNAAMRDRESCRYIKCCFTESLRLTDFSELKVAFKNRNVLTAKKLPTSAVGI